MKELTIEATVENLSKVMDFINSELITKTCSAKTLMHLELVIEEIFVNIASYAYEGDERPCILYIDFEEDPAAAVITFKDKGIPYNPLDRADPDVSQKLKNREVGGLGIFLVKKNVDGIWYEYANGENILSFRKILR